MKKLEKGQIKWIKSPNFPRPPGKKAGGVDTKRRGCYLIKKTGMVKFVKIEKIRVYEATDAKKKITWAGDLRKIGFGKSVVMRWREYINLDKL